MVRGETISYSSKVKKLKQNEIKELEDNITAHLDKFNETKNNSYLDTVDELKRQLEAKIQYETKGSIIRSKTVWHEEGEKSSSYFLNLEKRNFNNKKLSKLILDDNTTIYDDKDILIAEEQFYQQLYRSKYKQKQNIEHNFFQRYENIMNSLKKVKTF